MPEIGEVRILSDNIAQFIKNKIFRRIVVLEPIKLEKWLNKCCPNLTYFNETLDKTGGLLVTNVGTRGKFCYIQLQNNVAIGIQFGMSGNIRPEPTQEYLASYGKEKEEYLKHCLLRLEYIDPKDNKEGHIYYHDIRRFGRFSFYFTADELRMRLAKLGHDPIEDRMLTDTEILTTLRRNNHKNICKAILTDQSVIAGMGNYCKAEGLYKAGIHPEALVCNIPDQSLIILYKELHKLSHAAYNSGGASLYTFTGMNGDKSDFKEELEIYGKEGQRDKHGYMIQRIPDSKSPDGRSTFWVPEIQTIGILQSSPSQIQKILVKMPLKLPPLPIHKGK